MYTYIVYITYLHIEAAINPGHRLGEAPSPQVWLEVKARYIGAGASQPSEDQMNPRAGAVYSCRESEPKQGEPRLPNEDY